MVVASIDAFPTTHETAIKLRKKSPEDQAKGADHFKSRGRRSDIASPRSDSVIQLRDDFIDGVGL
jgi:hypothetical protein